MPLFEDAQSFVGRISGASGDKEEFENVVFQVVQGPNVQVKIAVKAFARYDYSGMRPVRQ